MERIRIAWYKASPYLPIPRALSDLLDRWYPTDAIRVTPTPYTQLLPGERPTGRDQLCRSAQEYGGRLDALLSAADSLKRAEDRQKALEAEISDIIAGNDYDRLSDPRRYPRQLDRLFDEHALEISRIRDRIETLSEHTDVLVQSLQEDIACPLPQEFTQQLARYDNARIAHEKQKDLVGDTDDMLANLNADLTNAKNRTSTRGWVPSQGESLPSITRCNCLRANADIVL